MVKDCVFASARKVAQTKFHQKFSPPKDVRDWESIMVIVWEVLGYQLVDRVFLPPLWFGVDETSSFFLFIFQCSLH